MKPLIESLPLMHAHGQYAAHGLRASKPTRLSNMTLRHDPHPVRDFFIGDLVDYAPKDSTEMMERPFFSLAKRKRNKPIEYRSPDGKVWIEVIPNPRYGMATIWDADILIWCISQLMAQKEEGRNELSGVIHTTPYELLRGIARATGGQEYRLLMAAIDRLRTTQVKTNIRSGRARHVSFHYLGDMEGDGSREEDAEGELSTLTLRVPDWLLEGVRKGSIVTLDREYFLLKGGLERAIYRAARKHAGNQKQGWMCRMSVLHSKTGAESPLKAFTYLVREMCKNNQLPRYSMVEVKTVKGETAVHFIDRDIYASLSENERQGAISQRAELAQTRDEARTAFIDGGYNPRDFQELWDELTTNGNAITLETFKELYPPK